MRMEPALVMSSTTSPVQLAGSSGASPVAGGSQRSHALAQLVAMNAGLASHSPELAQDAQFSLLSRQPEVSLGALPSR